MGRLTDRLTLGSRGRRLDDTEPEPVGHCVSGRDTRFRFGTHAAE